MPIKKIVTNAIEDNAVTTIQTVGDISNFLVPAGAIIMWSGASVPSGWVLCDDSAAALAANAPNLVNRFVVGAGSTYALDSTGGSATHTLTVDEMPSHNHPYDGTAAGDQYWALDSSETQNEGITSGDIEFTSRDAVSSQGGGQAHNNLPPYYALAYIMKLA